MAFYFTLRNGINRLHNFQEGADTFVGDGSIIPINAMLISAKTPAEKNKSYIHSMNREQNC